MHTFLSSPVETLVLLLSNRKTLPPSHLHRNFSLIVQKVPQNLWYIDFVFTHLICGTSNFPANFHCKTTWHKRDLGKPIFMHWLGSRWCLTSIIKVMKLNYVSYVGMAAFGSVLDEKWYEKGNVIEPKNPPYDSKTLYNAINAQL